MSTLPLNRVKKRKAKIEPQVFLLVGTITIAFASIILFFLSLNIAAETVVSTRLPQQTSHTPQHLLNVIPIAAVLAVTSPEPTIVGLPTRLKIPKIHVDTTLEEVGVTSQGAMGVPTDLRKAAWFNLSPRPGEIGSAVIDGHFGWKDGVQAVFDTLHALDIGDKLSIEDDKGVTMHFVVRELRTFNEDEDASSVFRSSGGGAHLNLITCQGEWNEAQQKYPQRFVVFTEREK